MVIAVLVALQRSRVLTTDLGHSRLGYKFRKSLRSLTSVARARTSWSHTRLHNARAHTLNILWHTAHLCSVFCLHFARCHDPGSDGKEHSRHGGGAPPKKQKQKERLQEETGRCWRAPRARGQGQVPRPTPSGASQVRAACVTVCVRVSLFASSYLWGG